MRSFDKPALSLDDQIQLLKARGLFIRDEAKAVALLEVVSLFRLKPYIRHFQQHESHHHRFQAGIGLGDIVALYRFDRDLRNLVMGAVERVEVATRACISNTMSTHHNAPHWYLNRATFKNGYDHPRLLAELRQKLEREQKRFTREADRIRRSRADDPLKKLRIERRMRDNYFRFYGQNYNDPDLPPSWAAFEELSLGTLSHLYQGIAHDSDRKKIARRFNLPHEVLGSWLHTLTFIRNCCAHHARLWNRELAISPKLPKGDLWRWPLLHPDKPHPAHRLFVVLLMLAHLMRHISPDSGWQARLESLLEEHPTIPLDNMGFIDHWRELSVWNGGVP